jgi:hypothetical protein
VGVRVVTPRCLGESGGDVSILEEFFTALNRHDVRYVVVGGLATVLHGFARLTADIDLIVDLDQIEARKTISVMVGLGLRPRAPVDPFSFADAQVRRDWVEGKGLVVLSFWNPTQPLQEVDLFVDNPINFAELWARAEEISYKDTFIRIASIPDLIHLKRLAGRPEDERDIEALEEILRRKKALTDG